MVSIAGLASSGMGEDIRPMRIAHRDARRGSVADHFKCPVRWQAEEDRLVFHVADLARPFASYNHELLDMLDRGLRQQTDGLRASETLTDQVRGLLRRGLTAGRPKLRSVAQELSISERSL